MLLGHAAVGSLAGRSLFRGLSAPLLVAAAYGPDWLDKPLKFLFGTPGHGIGHSGLVYGLLGAAILAAGRRLGKARPYALAALALWGAHLVCDWVDARVLFWPFSGWAFPDPHPESTLVLAGRFYSWPRMHPLAWIDLCLCGLAAWAWLAPLARRRMAEGVWRPLTERFKEEGMTKRAAAGGSGPAWNWPVIGLAGALAVCLIMAACGGPAPLKDIFPQTAAGMTLTELFTGPEALRRINVLHGGKVDAVDGAVAVYRTPEGRPAVIWVVQAPSPEIAERQTRTMLDSLLRAPLAHFRDPVTAEMNGLSITRFKGLEQTHFIFQSGDRSWWLSADPDAAAGLLSVFAAKAKED